jgi:hypothetical protein
MLTRWRSHNRIETKITKPAQVTIDIASRLNKHKIQTAAANPPRLVRR